MSKGLDLNALEALEVLWRAKQECDTSCSDMCAKCQKAKARDIIEKKLKVLEIIKEKGLYSDIYYNKGDNDYYAYDAELDRIVKLTKEEYDLLNEELFEYE